MNKTLKTSALAVAILLAFAVTHLVFAGASKYRISLRYVFGDGFEFKSGATVDFTNATLSGLALTAAALATDSVDSDEIAADAVDSSEIAADAVGTSEIATDGVDSAEIAADAVGTSEIATDGVDSAEIAAGAVDTSELASGAVDLANINLTEWIGGDPGATCTAGQIFIDTDETDDTNCNTTADNSLCLCTATDTWTALENN